MVYSSPLWSSLCALGPLRSGPPGASALSEAQPLPVGAGQFTKRVCLELQQESTEEAHLQTVWTLLRDAQWAGSRVIFLGHSSYKVLSPASSIERAATQATLAGSGRLPTAFSSPSTQYLILQSMC